MTFPLLKSVTTVGNL